LCARAYAGEISRSIREGLGFYVSPDVICRVIHRELGDVKRVWAGHEQGWKYSRRRSLLDY